MSIFEEYGAFKIYYRFFNDIFSIYLKHDLLWMKYLDKITHLKGDIIVCIQIFNATRQKSRTEAAPRYH